MESLEVDHMLLEATKEEVEKEMTQYLERRKDSYRGMYEHLAEDQRALSFDDYLVSKRYEYLNNFHVRLRTDEDSEMTPYRKDTELLGWWNLTGEEQIQAREQIYKDIDREVISTTEPVAHSQRWLHQTAQQFFQTIDEVVKSKGIAVDDLKASQNKNQLAFDAYITLRALGYTHPELTS